MADNYERLVGKTIVRVIVLDPFYGTCRIEFTDGTACVLSSDDCLGVEWEPDNAR